MDTVNLRGPGIKFENFEKFENLVLMISRDVFLIRTSCIEDGRRYAENKGRAKKLKFQYFYPLGVCFRKENMSAYCTKKRDGIIN